jgi:GTP pyrophosphokinase
MNTKDTLKITLTDILLNLSFEPEGAVDQILFAYDLAKAAHKGQCRDEGSEYITHPVEGCILLAKDYGIQNKDLYIIFLLHDTGEDTSLFGDRTLLDWSTFQKTLVSRITTVFGETVAQAILLLTKPPLSNTEFRTKEDILDYYLENLEKPSQVRDISVFCKMIDRLHNLRSLPSTDLGKVRRQILETESRLLPLFERVAKELEENRVTDRVNQDFRHKYRLVIQDIRSQLMILKRLV